MFRAGVFGHHLGENDNSETKKLSKFTMSGRLGKLLNSLGLVLEGVDAMMINIMT